MRRRFVVAVPLAGAIALAAIAGASHTSAAPGPPARRSAAEQFAFLQRHHAGFRSSAALVALGLAHQHRGDGDTFFPVPAAVHPAAAASSAATPPNVRVNDPALDTQTDQTTQSETTVAISGKNVVVGYNDSQRTLLAITAGSTLTGYSYSSDGGKTFHDGGSLNNPPGGNSFGDPWLGADRGGRFYYSALLGTPFGLTVAVARSGDGGRTFGTGVPITAVDGFENGDQDELAVGRDPQNAAADNVYVAWDDFGNCDPNGRRVVRRNHLHVAGGHASVRGRRPV